MSWRTEPDLVRVLDPYDMIGRAEFGGEWAGTEASAIRLGQGSKTDSEARKRGLAVLRALHEEVESGRLPLVYTDATGHRVRYPRDRSLWLTAIYPDPVGTGEGMVEFNDREIYPCSAEVGALRRRLGKLRVRPAKTGPGRGFTEFETQLDVLFQSRSPDIPNHEVRELLKRTPLIWPRKSHRNKLIRDARERARERARPVA